MESAQPTEEPEPHGVADSVEPRDAGSATWARFMPACLGRDLTWLFAVALAFGTLLKLVIALSPDLGRLDSDRAVLYLSAKHASRGDFSMWFWGQEYGGALFQDALGCVFAVTGAHLWMLPAGALLVSSTVPILTWRIGVRLGFPAHGAIAGALVSVGPPEALFLGVSSEAFYNVGLAASLGSLLVALAPGRLTTRQSLVSGLLSGVAVWSSPFSLITTLPTLAILIPRVRRARLQAVPLSVAATFGALPDIITTIRRGTWSPDTFGNSRSVSDRVEAAATGTWRDVWTRFDHSAVPDWLVDRVAVAALFVLILCGVVRLIELVDREKRDLRTAALLIPVVLWIPLHVRGHLPSDEPAARYGVPLLPFIALFVARWLRPALRYGYAVGALAMFTFAGIWQATEGISTSGHVVHNSSYARLAADLEAHGRRHVFADYWIAYRLTAETDERITADPPAMSRHPAYARDAKDAALTTVVVFAGGPNDDKLQQAFENEPGVERVTVAQFAIFYASRHLEFPGLAPTANLP